MFVGIYPPNAIERAVACVFVISPEDPVYPAAPWLPVYPPAGPCSPCGPAEPVYPIDPVKPIKLCPCDKKFLKLTGILIFPKQHYL